MKPAEILMYKPEFLEVNYNEMTLWKNIDNVDRSKGFKTVEWAQSCLKSLISVLSLLNSLKSCWHGLYCNHSLRLLINQAGREKSNSQPK